MKFYCIDDFKNEFDKLKSNKSYKAIEQEIINYFFNKNVAQLCSGTRLNNSSDVPYIKKRLGGRGGYRVYFLLLIRNESLYFMFVHPKTGSKGPDNITDESKTYLYKKVADCIKTNDLYELYVDDTSQTIQFKRLTYDQS